jgi:hypothetical protein
MAFPMVTDNQQIGNEGTGTGHNKGPEVRIKLTHHTHRQNFADDNPSKKYDKGNPIKDDGCPEILLRLDNNLNLLPLGGANCVNSLEVIVLRGVADGRCRAGFAGAFFFDLNFRFRPQGLDNDSFFLQDVLNPISVVFQPLLLLRAKCLINCFYNTILSLFRQIRIQQTTCLGNTLFDVNFTQQQILDKRHIGRGEFKIPKLL